MPWERLVHRSATEGRMNAAFVAAVLLSVQYEQMRLHRCFGCCPGMPLWSLPRCMPAWLEAQPNDSEECAAGPLQRDKVATQSQAAGLAGAVETIMQVEPSFLALGPLGLSRTTLCSGRQHSAWSARCVTHSSSGHIRYCSLHLHSHTATSPCEAWRTQGLSYPTPYAAGLACRCQPP